jgi:hypothetical protein
MKNVMLILSLVLMVAACGKAEEVVVSASDIFGGSSGSAGAACASLTGNYSKGSFADLSIVQDG